MCNSCDSSSRNFGYLIENREAGTPDQTINCNDPCSIIIGFYCFYGTEARAMECEEWAEVCDFRKIVRMLKYTNFSIQSMRDSALSAMAAMKVEAPFSYQTRFPSDVLFVNITCGAYSGIIRQIVESLNFKEREKEVQNRINPSKADPEHPGGRVFSFDDALHSYHKGVEQLNRLLCQREEIYSRETFERKYGIKWAVGKPKGPTYIDPCDPNNPSPFPPDPRPPPNRPLGNYGSLVQAVKEKGLNPSDFVIFVNPAYNIRPRCGQETINFDKPEDKKKMFFSASVYVFTKADYMKCNDGPVDTFIYYTDTGTLAKGSFEGKSFDSLESDSDFADAFVEVSSNSKKKRNKGKDKDCH